MGRLKLVSPFCCLAQVFEWETGVQESSNKSEDVTLYVKQKEGTLSTRLMQPDRYQKTYPSK